MSGPVSCYATGTVCACDTGAEHRSSASKEKRTRTYRHGHVTIRIGANAEPGRLGSILYKVVVETQYGTCTKPSA